MAFNFRKFEAVGFGDLQAMPKMDAELNLRVSSLEITNDNLDEVRDTLASCFGEKAAEVKAFMKDNMFLMDFMRLQVYLTQGENGLKDFERRMDRVFDKQISEAMNNNA